MFKQTLRLVLLPAAAAVLVACGGGGGGSPSASLPKTLSGTAAIGAPMNGANVYLTDSTGRTAETTADSAGTYSFTASQLEGMRAPLILAASVQLGERKINHYSLVNSIEGNVIANVTPLSSAVVALLSESPVLSPLTVQQLSNLTASQLDNAKNKVKAAVKPLSDQMVEGSFDPISTPIQAIGEGVDELLDHVDLTVDENSISLMNKMKVVSDSSSNASSSAISIQKASTQMPDPLPADRQPTAAIGELYSQFVRCFATPTVERMVVQSATEATLSINCSDIAVPEYKNSGVDFKTRWARFLKSDTLKIGDGAVFYMPEVRLALNSQPLRLAVNFNFLDNTGTGYTIPEIIEFSEEDQKWRLYGNRRSVSMFVDANANYYADLSKYPNYVNLNTSKIEAGIQLTFDPRVIFDQNGNTEYNFTDYTTKTGFKDPSPTYKEIYAKLTPGQSMVGCVVVTGPGRFTTDNETRWMGMYPHGTVMKRPSGSSRQDYMAFSTRMSQSQYAELSSASLQSFVDPKICGNGITDDAASFYAFDIQALKNQVNPMTGQLDTEINGRPAAWNLGARYARTAPDADMKKELDSKPVFTVYVIDGNHKLQMRLKTRYLGDIPTVQAVKAWHDDGFMAKFKPETISAYLSFDAAKPTSKELKDVSSAEWVTNALGFSPDLVGFYSQIYQGIPGEGLHQNDPLRTTDADLAEELTGNNFWHRNARFAKLKENGTCSIKSKSLVSTNSFLVKRSDRSFTSTRDMGKENPYYGLDSLDNACLTDPTFTNGVLTALAPATYRIESYVYREVWNRTYTGNNIRLYYLAANRKLKE
jgi:hypothetical protein